MTIIKTEEIQENGMTYIVNTYDNGTVEKYIKPDPDAVTPEPEPQPKPVTNEDISDKLDENQQLQLAGMQGQSDTYAAILAMQETINAQQQLILANMQGLSDVYSTLLALQTTGTEA